MFSHKKRHLPVLQIPLNMLYPKLLVYNHLELLQLHLFLLHKRVCQETAPRSGTALGG